MSQTVNLGHVVGPGVPNGGTAGQILKKNSTTNFDTSWVDNTAEITEMSSSDDRTVAQAIGSVEASIAIVVNGDNAPQNLSVGQYIFLKNHSTLPSGGRHVTASISSGSAITSNNTAADSDGIANALNSKIATLVKKTRTVTTTDSDGDTQALNNITQKAILGVIPVRNAGDGTYSGWFGVIIGAHSGTGLSVKCINDNNEKLASTKVAMDVYYIEQTFS